MEFAGNNSSGYNIIQVWRSRGREIPKQGKKMDFLLVPNKLTASEARDALAHRNNMGTMVCSFSVLLDALAELWPIELSGMDLNASLKGRPPKRAAWTKSVRLYEPATIAGLKARIKFLLSHPPRGMRPKVVPPMANRNERYFHDLISFVWLIEQRLSTNQADSFLVRWRSPPIFKKFFALSKMVEKYG